MRAVAQNRHGALVERSQHEFPFLSVGKRNACFGIYYLRIKIVFEYVQAVLFAALSADSRPGDFRKPIDVEF